MNLLSRFLVQLGGDSPELLSRSSEKARIKRIATGSAVFVPCTIAAFGSGFTTHWMTGNLTFAIIAGLCWGTLIALVDRALLATIVKGKFQFMGTLIRLAMAVVASAIFAHPLVLEVFEGNLVSRIESERTKEVQSLQASTDQRIDELRDSRKDDLILLEDQLTALLTQQETTDAELEKVAADLRAWRQKHHNEVEGLGASSQQGDGPLARAMMNNYILPLSQQAGDLRQRQSRLDLDRQRLTRDLDSLQKEIAANPEIARAQAALLEKTSLLEGQDRGDLLTRLRTLHQIMEEDQNVAWAYYALTLLLLLLELSPLLAKMVSSPDDYDFALASQQLDARAEKDALCHYLPEMRAEIIREDLALDTEVQRIRRDEMRNREKLGQPHQLASAILNEKGRIFQLLAKEDPPVPPETSRAGEFYRVSDQIDDSILNHFEELVASLHPSKTFTPSSFKSHHDGKPEERPAASPIPFPETNSSAGSS